MIPGLLPGCAIGVQAYEPDWDPSLLPEEAPLVVRAVEKRRREFAAGRNCARRALAALGLSDDAPILAGAKREPLWPSQVVGSITHSAGYCAAAVARSGDLRGLGIDAERNAPLSDGVVRKVCTPHERRVTGSLLGASAPALVFSAKESVYKAWFPLTGRWLGYLDAEITFDVPASRFTVRILSPAAHDALPPTLTFAGRFGLTDEHVFTVVTATSS